MAEGVQSDDGQGWSGTAQASSSATSSAVRVLNGVLIGRILPIAGRVFEQQGEEAAQPVLGVGSGVAVDRHNAQLAGGSVADPRLCTALGFFQVDALVAFACSRPGRRRSDTQGER